MKLSEKTLSSETVYDGRIIRVRRDIIELPDGKTAVREVVDHNGGAGVAALDDDGALLLVRQLRYPLGEETLEVPAGKLEKGEDPACAIVRELREETGCTADRIEYLGVNYPTPGYCAEKLYLYLATGLHAGAQQLDEDEYLNVERVPFAEVVRRIYANEIRDSKTVAAVLLAQKRLAARAEKEGVHTL